tara:strand:- start:108 stop:335 length:228 start_codon:yes stop_codon:yes gene_type:complete
MCRDPSLTSSALALVVLALVVLHPVVVIALGAIVLGMVSGVLLGLGQGAAPGISGVIESSRFRHGSVPQFRGIRA